MIRDKGIRHLAGLIPG